MARQTARDLVIDALRTSGAISAIEVPENEEVSHALNELNNIIDQWNIQELIPFTSVETEFQTATGVATYSIGSGETIDIARPNFVSAIAINIGDTYRPIKMVDEIEWSTLNKSTIVDGVPSAAVYHRSMTPTIELWPIPSSIWTATMTSSIRIGNFLINDLLNLPDGYYPAIQYALAEILALHYGTDNYAIIQAKAVQMLANIKRMNTQVTTLSYRELPRSGNYGSYDVTSDTFI